MKYTQQETRILVIDPVIGDEKSGGTFAKLLDVQMLIEQRGCECTAEFQIIFAAGLKRVILLPTLQDIVEFKDFFGFPRPCHSLLS